MRRTTKNFFVILGAAAVIACMPFYFTACNAVPATTHQIPDQDTSIPRRVILLPEETPSKDDLLVVLKANKDTIDLGYWHPAVTAISKDNHPIDSLWPIRVTKH